MQLRATLLRVECSCRLIGCGPLETVSTVCTICVLSAVTFYACAHFAVTMRTTMTKCPFSLIKPLMTLC
jgi:hypothetical protein